MATRFDSGEAFTFAGGFAIEFNSAGCSIITVPRSVTDRRRFTG